MSWVTHFHICLLCFWPSFFKCRLIKEVLTFVFGLSCCGEPHNCRLFGKKTYNYWNRSWKLALKILNVIPISLWPFDIFSTLSLFSRAKQINPFWLPDYNFASLSYNQAFRSFWPDIFLFFQPFPQCTTFALPALHPTPSPSTRNVWSQDAITRTCKSQDQATSNVLLFSFSVYLSAFVLEELPDSEFWLYCLWYKVFGTRNENRETSKQNGKSKV